MRELEAKRDAGTSIAAGRRPTLGQWLEHWLDKIASRDLKAKTVDNYRYNIQRHLLPGLGHHALDRLQPEHLEALYKAMEDKGVGPATVRLSHNILSGALKVALQRGRVVRNVAQLVQPPKPAAPKIKPLTVEEAQRVLAAAQPGDNSARWSVALALGLRQGEALGLRWENVDLEAGTITVRWALQRQKGKGLVLVEPKSRAGRRTLALPQALHEALRLHRKAQLEQRLRLADAYVDGGYVFAQPNGRPLGASQDWAAWKRLLKAAGVHDARLHDARHTAATLLMAQGVDVRVVMILLGHSQISMTMRYTHAVPALAQDAARRVDAALWPASS